MNLHNYPELKAFLSETLSNIEADRGAEREAVSDLASRISSDELAVVAGQVRALKESDSRVEDLGMEANRWFSSPEECDEWLEFLVKTMTSQGASVPDHLVVTDSNGTVLSDGDSVTVIKDLKVKGGSSDLKRGAMIKKIRIVGDPDVIECNVGGSTLVLKTCFLKKA